MASFDIPQEGGESFAQLKDRILSELDLLEHDIHGRKKLQLILERLVDLRRVSVEEYIDDSKQKLLFSLARIMK